MAMNMSTTPADTVRYFWVTIIRKSPTRSGGNSKAVRITVPVMNWNSNGRAGCKS